MLPAQGSEPHGRPLAALPYWSEKGCGSRPRPTPSRSTAAAHAPEGTLLPALPLFAVYEHLPEVNVVRGLYQSAEVEKAIEAAEYAVDQVEGDHPCGRTCCICWCASSYARSGTRGDGGAARRGRLRGRGALGGLGRPGDPLRRLPRTGGRRLGGDGR